MKYLSVLLAVIGMVGCFYAGMLVERQTFPKLFYPPMVYVPMPHPVSFEAGRRYYWRIECGGEDQSKSAYDLKVEAPGATTCTNKEMAIWDDAAQQVRRGNLR